MPFPTATRPLLRYCHCCIAAADRTAELCATQTTHDAIGTPAATFKIRRISELSDIFETHKCPSIDFFSPELQTRPSEQSCLEAAGPHDGLVSACFLSYLVLSAPPFHLRSCFPIFPSFLNVLSQPLSSVVEKHRYI